MKEHTLKDVALAILAFGTIMLYVEVRMSHINMNGVHYGQVGMVRIDDNGKALYTPVYQEK